MQVLFFIILTNKKRACNQLRLQTLFHAKEVTLYKSFVTLVQIQHHNYHYEHQLIHYQYLKSFVIALY